MASPLSPKLDWQAANPLWAQALNPVIANQILQGKMITSIFLPTTTPLVINHGLGRNMIGWFLVDKTANANVWRTQDFNSKTITLEASAATTIALWVF